MTNDEIVDLFNYKNKNKLKNGMIFKNYKELCEFLGWKNASGNTKIEQMKELSCVCKWHKECQKIIIDEVFIVPKKKSDSCYFSKAFSNYFSTSGVYLITDKYGRKYVGSAKNVYKRFIEHRKKDEQSGSRFLDKESMEIEIFEFTRGIDDREFLYEVEAVIIEECFKLGMNLTNKKNKNSYKKVKKKENEIKYIKVKNNDYQRALEILKENGIVA